MQSLLFNPDHQEKSSRVAGCLLRKYLRVSIMSASSRSVFILAGSFFPARAYVAFRGSIFPLQSTPDISDSLIWYESRWSSIFMSFSASARMKSSLVALPRRSAVEASMSRIRPASSEGMLILLVVIQPLVTARAFGAQRSSICQ